MRTESNECFKEIWRECRHLFPFISGRLWPKWVPVTDTVSPSPRARTFSHTTYSTDSTYIQWKELQGEKGKIIGMKQLWNIKKHGNIVTAIDYRQWRVICRNINFTQLCTLLYLSLPASTLSYSIVKLSHPLYHITLHSSSLLSPPLPSLPCSILFYSI